MDSDGAERTIRQSIADQQHAVGFRDGGHAMHQRFGKLLGPIAPLIIKKARGKSVRYAQPCRKICEYMGWGF